MWGFDVSHLASHLGALQLRPEFFDVYLELAVDFGLPLRLGDGIDERVAGFPFRRLAAEEGVVFPDQVVVSPPGARRRFERLLFELAAGRHRDLASIPAIDTDELRAAFEIDWSGRVEDHVALRRDPSFRDLVERAGATVVGWREFRDLQRADAARAAPASTSSTRPGSPAVFSRPCMKATLGSSSPAAIAAPSG